MATVYERDDMKGRYIRAMWKSRTGKRGSKIFRLEDLKAKNPDEIRNKKDAMAWVKNWAIRKEDKEKRIARGLVVDASDSVTLDHAFDRFIRDISTKKFGDDERKYRRSTIDDYRTYYRNHIDVLIADWEGGEMKLGDINAGRVAKWINALEKSGRSMRTVGRVRSVLKKLFTYALSEPDFGVSTNPVADAGKNSAPVGGNELTERNEKEIPSKKEANAMIAYAREVRDMELKGRDKKGMPLGNRMARGTKGWFYTYMVMALLSGMRGGELRGLRWSDISDNEGVLYIRTAADRYGDTPGVKTTAALREVPYGSTLRKVLKEYRERWVENPGGYLFAGEEGEPMTPTGPGKRIRKMMYDLGLTKFDAKKDKDVPRYSGHNFRHYAISVWIAEGLRGLALTKPAGHKKESFTRETYWHLFDEDLKKSRSVIADAGDDWLDLDDAA